MNCGQCIKELKGFQFDEKAEEYQGVIWDGIFNCFYKKKFKIEIMNQSINYISNDGQILRIDQRTDCYQKPKILTNLDQIKHLQKYNICEQNMNNTKRINLMWKGEALENNGGECCTYIRIKIKIFQRAYQQFLEVQLCLNCYNSLAQVYQAGKYENEKRIGSWQYYYQDQVIGGGSYNQLGIKIGKWIELSENFWKYSQVTLTGLYKNGQKIGRWAIKWIENNLNDVEIGHGYYDKQNEKTGKWFEPSDKFSLQSQIIFSGEYKNGKKIGKWQTYWRIENNEIKEIGGGQYKYPSLKNGKWIELSDNFNNENRFTYVGEYKDGKKIGLWDFFYWKVLMQQKQVIITIQSGCGLYDEQNLQNGKWIELSDNFAYESEVIFIGNYQKGKKISKWDIQFRYYDNFQSIGGGSYNEDNLKDGEWIELSDNFHNFSQVLWHGKYNIGQKVDRWNCFYEGELIGSGFYDDLNLKNGKWIEPSDNFQYYRQIKFEGWYKNGKKIGKWDLYWQGEGKNQDFELIGGGYYNEQSIKIGIWIEISDDFQKLKQVVYKGEYQNGKKVQIWKIQWRDQTQNQFIAIGGGQYNKKGMKIGKWIELSDQFQIGSRIFFLGQYKNCLKVGNWEIHYQDFEDNYQLIGGGFYDDETNLKNGIWIEQDDNFWNGNYQIWIGKYKNAQKIGDWIKMKRNESIKNQDFQRVQYICNSSGEYQFNI